MKKIHETLLHGHPEQGAVRVPQGHAPPPRLLPRDRPACPDRGAAREGRSTSPTRPTSASRTRWSRRARLQHGFMQVYPYTDGVGQGGATAGESLPDPRRVPALRDPLDRPAALLRLLPDARGRPARPHDRGHGQRARPRREALRRGRPGPGAPRRPASGPPHPLDRSPLPMAAGGSAGV